MRKKPLDLPGFVEAVQSDSILITVEDHSIAHRLEGIGFVQDSTGTYKMGANTDAVIAKVFIELRDMGFAFSVGPPAWSPSELFEHYRKNGLVSGEFIEIYWTGPGVRHTRIV